MTKSRQALAAVLLLGVTTGAHTATTEFCLDGELDLGARYQGERPQPGEYYPARWCVTTEDGSDNVLLSISGNSNPDMIGSWVVAFAPPDLVRIVNADSPPDVVFRTNKATAEAARTRMLDPRLAGPEGRARDEMMSVTASVDLPLRGRVPVTWRWELPHSDAPRLEINVDGQVLFRGTGSRRTLDDNEAAALWQPTAGADPIDIPGDRWPARVAMELVELSDGVYVVQGVRTGFHHMVVDTAAGLVVADAPAGWVELHQFPPVDMVPRLGVSGLSERLVDFLADEFPGRPIRAVALTHHHDDHAGGARAFAAAGAAVYAPAEVASFLGAALNRESMPPDRLNAMGHRVAVRPVDDQVMLDDDTRPVQLINMGKSPHVISSLGVLAGGFFFQSDLHVPNSDAEVPRSNRAETECWFAAWAAENLPDGTIIINTHSRFQTPVSRLVRYLESGSC
jgi:hypothetical protein